MTVVFVENDGGRSASGFKGRASDCGVRAAAIVLGVDYRETYDTLFRMQRIFKANSRRLAVKARSASPRDGVWKEIMHQYMIDAGAQWIALADIGGVVVRVRDVAERWPVGRIVMRLGRHYSVMIDGVNIDTWAQHPEKRVYGIWIMAGEYG